MGQEPEGVLRRRTMETGSTTRRKTPSNSRAEEIVTCEQKARKAQPDRPIHSPCDSLLSWSSQFSNYEGLFNWAVLLLFLGSLRICLENLHRYGIRVSPMRWVRYLFGDNNQLSFPVVYLLMYSCVTPLTALMLEKLLARCVMEWRTAYALHTINLILHILMPVLLNNTRFLNVFVFSSVLACGVYILVFLKLVSYIQVNKWCRDSWNTRKMINQHMARNGDFFHRQWSVSVEKHRQRTEQDLKNDEIEIIDKNLVHWPHNLSVKDLAYFLCVPTLCYELNFPRTKRIRKIFLLRRILEVILGTNLMLALTQQWIVPNVVDTLVPFDSLDWSLTMERLLKLALPSHILWLLGFYLYFHSFLNTVGELLQFADRDFYHDWWNSRNVEKFWQNWNLPVHKWCVRHLYKPVLEKGFSKLLAMLLVFFLSAFFHEYLVSVPLKMFKPWAFVGILSQVVLIIISKKIELQFGYQLGNMTVWASIILGEPLFLMVYVHDYVIENYGQNLVKYYGQIQHAVNIDILL